RRRRARPAVPGLRAASRSHHDHLSPLPTPSGWPFRRPPGALHALYRRKFVLIATYHSLEVVMSNPTELTRRRMLLGGAAVGAGALLAGCTSNETNSDTGQTKVAQGNNAAPGQTVTIGFSAPAADHGWIRAITDNAKSQAGKYSDVKLTQVD